MSRFPALSTAGDRVPASIFAKLREHLARFPGDVIPLQIGDTHLAPPATLDSVPWKELSANDLYAYGNPPGWPPLMEAIVEKVWRQNHIAATTANVQIGCGATHALSATVQALCDPGDDLILLSPHWPLIKGMAIGFHVKPVEVSMTASIEEIERHCGPRTAAIYYATPNNPDGMVLSEERLAEFAELAVRKNLWIIADEVYEHYGYEDAHFSIASFDEVKDRTVTVFSFAKSYAQAGMRIGYAIAPETVAGALRKLINHSVYNVPVAMQRLALGAMRKGDTFLSGARTRYRAARDRAHARLGDFAPLPTGGAYLWLDLRSASPDGDCMPILEKCAGKGVLLAPGHAFGDAYKGYARLCFTGVEETRLDEGITRVLSVLRP